MLIQVQALATVSSAPGLPGPTHGKGTVAPSPHSTLLPWLTLIPLNIWSGRIPDHLYPDLSIPVRTEWPTLWPAPCFVGLSGYTEHLQS